MGLDVRVLDAIDEVLGSKESLRQDVPVQLLVADATGLTNMEALGVLSAIRNLARQKSAYRLTDDQMIDDLRAIGGPGIELSEAKILGLFRLIRKSDDDYFYEKAESLRGALLPHMVSARTVCDVRPIFDQERGNVDAGLIVTYLDMRVHDNSGQYDSLVVSLTVQDLRELGKTIEATLKKVEVIKKGFGGHIELFD